MVAVRPPICELCDNRFDPKDGALLSFRPTSTHTLNGKVPTQSGHPDNQGWFCEQHHEEANELTDSTLRGALAELRSPMRLPGKPMRRTFDAVAKTRVVAIKSRSAEGIRTSMIQAHRDLAPLFDPPLSGVGSNSVRHPLPMSPHYPDANEYRVATAASKTGQDSSHFVSRCWNDANQNRVAEHSELVVAISGAIRLSVTFTPEPANPTRCRELVISHDPSFTQAMDLTAAIQRLVSTLDTADFDPFSLAPELEGVDLKGGRLAGSVAFETKNVEWPLNPTPVTRVEAALRQHLGSLTLALDAANGLQTSVISVPDLVSETKRSWTPMDGSQPPDCPFSDTTTASGSLTTSCGVTVVSTSLTLTHWSEDKVANSSASLHLRPDQGDQTALISASTHQGRTVSELRLGRPTTAEVIEAVASIVDSLNDESF